MQLTIKDINEALDINVFCELFTHTSSCRHIRTAWQSGAVLDNFRGWVVNYTNFFREVNALSLYRLGIFELSKLLNNKEISARELAKSVFERIEQVEDRIKAYVTITREEAMGMAEIADRELSAGNGMAVFNRTLTLKDSWAKIEQKKG